MQTERRPATGAGRRPRPARWLIARDGAGGLEPLCVEGGAGRRVLPVFSFEEEAELFLHLGDHDGDGWRARESGAGELASVLCGPCADVGSVALDPLPGMPEDGTANLVEVGRERFLGGLTGRR